MARKVGALGILNSYNVCIYRGPHPITKRLDAQHRNSREVKSLLASNLTVP